MTDLLLKLGRSQQRGSKPRCHWLTHGTTEEVSARLTSLIAPWGDVSPTDCWMPNGFEDTEEAQLHQSTRLLDSNVGEQLKAWWLAVARGQSRTPNFDIASTCSVKVNGESRKGLLLIEAKAHDQELIQEEAGKQLKPSEGSSGVSINSRRNHVRIGACIEDASLALTGETGLPWTLSRDWKYQMSNRFAWAWKLTELGIPVILVYLGFLKAEDMREGKKTPFADEAAWESLVKDHSAPLFPSKVWDKPWTVHGQPLIPLIRSLEIAHDKPIQEARL